MYGALGMRQEDVLAAIDMTCFELYLMSLEEVWGERSVIGWVFVIVSNKKSGTVPPRYNFLPAWYRKTNYSDRRRANIQPDVGCRKTKLFALTSGRYPADEPVVGCRRRAPGKPNYSRRRRAGIQPTIPTSAGYRSDISWTTTASRVVTWHHHL